MHIEAMVGYPQDYKVGTSSTNLAIMGLRNQISNLTEKFKDLALMRPIRCHVWCMHCQIEGRHIIE